MHLSVCAQKQISSGTLWTSANRVLALPLSKENEKAS